MASKMWWMCQDKMITSFQAEVIDTLFDDFNFSTINTTVNQWINQQFNGSFPELLQILLY
ncbi:hypothetical protein [Enterococcus faecalis]|uniref:hypothetical protein n=1 Tax=Enterococcus faecalis TaxID=1351 RepID=UPI002FBE0CDE